jgi:hypothetical protein
MKQERITICRRIRKKIRNKKKLMNERSWKKKEDGR